MFYRTNNNWIIEGVHLLSRLKKSNLSTGKGNDMVFKKKVEKNLYCIAIFVEEDLDEDEYEYVNFFDRTKEQVVKGAGRLIL